MAVKFVKQTHDRLHVRPRSRRRLPPMWSYRERWGSLRPLPRSSLMHEHGIGGQPAGVQEGEGGEGAGVRGHGVVLGE